MNRSPKPAIMVLIICLLSFTAAFGEDYLIIKKKGGSAQKVPLEFAPDQIESFRVEQGAPSTDGAAKKPIRDIGVQKSEQAKPESSAPMIYKKPLTETTGPQSMPSQPPADEDADQTEDQGDKEQPVMKDSPAPLPRGPQAGPVGSATPLQRGLFSVNVYKLPEDTKTLPDFSAFRPIKTVATDRINFEPAKGENEPSGIENTDLLGLRFVGMFAVSGEGIFKWRLQSKDGSRLHIDDKTLIENDGAHDATSKTGYAHLNAGVHSIVVDGFNLKGSPNLKLFVQPPRGPEQIFGVGSTLAGWQEPAKPYDVLWGQVFFVPKGNYPDGPKFDKLNPIGRVIASELNLSGDEGIPGLPGRKDMVGVQYKGFFNVTGAGIFAFRLLADEFGQLTIGKQSIIETGGKDSAGKLGWAFLQEGAYPITVDYFHKQGANKLELQVTAPEKDEVLFNPSKPLVGFASDTGKVSLIPAFVYFLKSGSRKLPNYNKMSPSGMFFTRSIDFPYDRGSKEFPGVPKKDEWLGLRFYVKFTLSEQESGNYKFRLVSTDAAHLILGKKMVINIEAPEGKAVEKTGSVDLPAGSHEMFLDFMQTTGQNALQLYITPPGGQEKIFAFQ